MWSSLEEARACLIVTVDVSVELVVGIYLMATRMRWTGQGRHGVAIAHGN